MSRSKAFSREFGTELATMLDAHAGREELTLASYNAATDEYGDLIGAGVIDPVKVTRSALANAASIASLLLTTETLVVEKPEEETPASAGHGHAH